MKVHTCRNVRVFGHLRVFSSRLCGCQLHWGSINSSFDICSSPPMEQVSQESTTCSLAESGAKEPPTDANTRTRTHTRLHKLQLLSGVAV